MTSEIPGTSAWEVLWILFVLVMIVALIIVMLRFIGKRNRGWWMNRSLRSLGGLPVGANKSLQVVEWNGRIYVLGVGENVTLLEAITDADTVSALLAEHDTAAETNAPNLPSWLRRLSGRAGNESLEDSQVRQPSSSFEKTLENRLRQLSERRQKAEQLLDRRDSEDRTDEP